VLIGQPIPEHLTAGTRDSHLWGMLADAARVCRERGERLVLVVDGLDEDRGVRIGSASHSIAALLPVQPPEGLRVIVASRSNPGIPVDVPDDHPLRSPAIVRRLGVSPAARAVRASTERELDALLEGPAEDQDFLGLLVAARGGLSSRDLAELTGTTPRRVEKRLNSVAGRSFSRTPSYWRPGVSPEMYLLGHGNLMNAAAEELGETALGGYWRRLRSWGERYREQHWPEGTPEYLLRGYFQILRTTGDVDGMVTCAIDTARHDRLFEVSGGDAAALSELSAAQDTLAGESAPDVARLIKVAMHREHLADRNARTPTSLARLWARLGHFNRAEALIEAIADPGRRADAVIGVMGVMVHAGDPARAEALVMRVTEQEVRDDVLASLTYLLGATGNLERAQELVNTITDPVHQVRALESLVHELGYSGDLDRAEELTQTIGDPPHRDRVPMAFAEVLAAAGEVDRAETLARQLTLPSSHPIARLVRVVASTGDTDRAQALADTVTDPISHNLAIVALIDVAGVAGDLQRAKALASAAIEPNGPGLVAGALAGALCRAGHVDEAKALTDTITNDITRQNAVMGLIRMLAAAGNLDQAEALAQTLVDSSHDSGAFSSYQDGIAVVVRAMGATGEVERAKALIQTMPAPTGFLAGAKSLWIAKAHAEAMTALAEGLCDGRRWEQAGDLAREAGEIARAAVHSKDYNIAITALADVAATSNDLRRGEALARLLIEPDQSSQAAGVLARLISASGDPDLAETLAEAMNRPQERANVLFTLARRAYQSGDRQRAHRLADHAEALVPGPDEPQHRWHVAPALAGVIASAGETQRARPLSTAFPTLTSNGTPPSTW
jgi:tetratricopeptide (TPR) repeat protein